MKIDYHMMKLLTFAQKHNIFVHNNYLWKYDTHMKVSRIIWPNDFYSINQYKKNISEKTTNIS